MVLPFAFTGCAGRHSGVDNDPFHLKNSRVEIFGQKEADEVSQRIYATNLGLKTVKGVGGLKFQSGKDKISSRLAWASEESGKMRLEVIGPDGRPLFSLSSDGQFVYFYSHGKKKYYKKRILNKNLSDYLGIPLEPQELASVLSGKVPPLSPDRIALIKNPTEEGFILLLFEKKSEQTTRIFLAADRQTFRKMEKRTSKETLLYEVLFENVKTVNHYAIPFTLLITDAAGATFQLKMNKVLDNPAIDDSVFIIKKRDGN
jgi:outer membrane lipoprotein-sorting protein